MENPPIFKLGKPSISMGHGLTMAMFKEWQDGRCGARMYPPGNLT